MEATVGEDLFAVDLYGHLARRPEQEVDDDWKEGHVETHHWGQLR